MANRAEAALWWPAQTPAALPQAGSPAGEQLLRQLPVERTKRRIGLRKAKLESPPADTASLRPRGPVTLNNRVIPLMLAEPLLFVSNWRAIISDPVIVEWVTGIKLRLSH